MWRSFQLDPTAPREATESIAEHLGSKYGGGADGRPADDRPGHRGRGRRGAGLRLPRRPARLAPSTPTGCSTSRTPRAGRRCRASSRSGCWRPTSPGPDNPADHAVLTEAALAVGLPAARVAAVLGSDEYADEVAADVAAGHGLRRDRGALLRRRPQVRRLRRPAGRGVHPGARAGVGGVAAARPGRRPGRRVGGGVRPRRLRRLMPRLRPRLVLGPLRVAGSDPPRPRGRVELHSVVRLPDPIASRSADPTCEDPL